MNKLKEIKNILIKNYNIKSYQSDNLIQNIISINEDTITNEEYDEILTEIKLKPCNLQKYTDYSEDFLTNVLCEFDLQKDYSNLLPYINEKYFSEKILRCLHRLIPDLYNKIDKKYQTYDLIMDAIMENDLKYQSIRKDLIDNDLIYEYVNYQDNENIFDINYNELDVDLLKDLITSFYSNLINLIDFNQNFEKYNIIANYLLELNGAYYLPFLNEYYHTYDNYIKIIDKNIFHLSIITDKNIDLVKSIFKNYYTKKYNLYIFLYITPNLVNLLFEEIKEVEEKILKSIHENILNIPIIKYQTYITICNKVLAKDPNQMKYIKPSYKLDENDLENFYNAGYVNETNVQHYLKLINRYV